MKRNSMKSKLSLILCVVLIAALALFAAGCSGDGNSSAKTFTFVVVDPEGNETSREITSDAATVGDALLAEGLIEGEDGEYGLYVMTVNGITLDYEADGMYWGFYIDGEYALTGVDVTEITEGATYTFQADAV